MKKIMMGLFGILMMSIALATISPAPIGGKITCLYGDTAYPAVNQLVTLTNLRTSEIVTTQTTPMGEFIVDWANTIQKYQSGDVVVIKVDGITSEVLLPDASLSFINLPTVCKVSPLECPECPVCPECPTCPKPIECDSCCPECEECPTIPPSDFDWVLFVGGGMAGLLLLLGGVTIYFKAHKARIQVYKSYRRKDGTIGKKWITIYDKGRWMNWDKLRKEVYE